MPRFYIIRYWLFSVCLFYSSQLVAQETMGGVRNHPHNRAKVKTGAEVFIEKHLSLVDGKRVGLLCNASSILVIPEAAKLPARYTSIPKYKNYEKLILDSLISLHINISAIFSPEHGFREDASAGENVESQIDEATGIPVYSLYGKTYKPTKEMMEYIDVLVFDMQDVGSRYFTYASTMAYAMQACIENKKQFILLDRPNPIGLNDVEGFIMEDSLKSFVGKFPIPNRHGLTLGELAKMIVGEHWIPNSDSLQLTIIPCEKLTRDLYWDDMGRVSWFPPSPNIVTPMTALLYAGMCLFEGTNVSEGRGTISPFQYIGAPWMDGGKIAEGLRKKHLGGVEIRPSAFVPISIFDSVGKPKYLNQECSGISLSPSEDWRESYVPLKTAIALLAAIKKQHPDSLRFNTKQFDRLAGSKKLREAIEAGKSAEEISLMWKKDVETFMAMRKKYLLYK